MNIADVFCLRSLVMGAAAALVVLVHSLIFGAWTGLFSIVIGQCSIFRRAGEAVAAA